MNLQQQIKFFFFKRALLRAINRANRERSITKYRMAVMKVGGWPKVYRICDLKAGVANKQFKKGVTIETIRKNALYLTN
jgi:hypothetical protein